MIEAHGVDVTFPQRGRKRAPIRALSGFELSIEKGESLALLGPNGSGKSTAMHTFLGLIQPDAGTVRLFGERPHPGAAIFERIAYLPEEPHYHLYLTVQELVRYYASLYRNRLPEHRIDESIERVGLGESRDLRLSKCSKGMKQRAGIAACLVRRPDLLFLDEPMRGLDPGSVKDFREVLKSMNEEGTTIIVSSHILAEVETMCRRAAILQGGKVLLEKDIEEWRCGSDERYRVELERTETRPESVKVLSEEGNRTVASVEASHMPELFRWAQEHGVEIFTCTRFQSSLEEAFLEALEEDA